MLPPLNSLNPGYQYHISTQCTFLYNLEETPNPLNFQSFYKCLCSTVIYWLTTSIQDMGGRGHKSI